MRSLVCLLLILTPPALAAQARSQRPPSAPIVADTTTSRFLVEFEARRKRHHGGQYLTAAQLDAAGDDRVADVIAKYMRVPRHCRPHVFWNGLLTSEGVDVLGWARDFGGVEFYTTGFIPPQYRRDLRLLTSASSPASPRGSACGALLLWSRT